MAERKAVRLVLPESQWEALVWRANDLGMTLEGVLEHAALEQWLEYPNGTRMPAPSPALEGEGIHCVRICGARALWVEQLHKRSDCSLLREAWARVVQDYLARNVSPGLAPALEAA